ncbi:prostaglandin E2 receptor EP3 subtype [Acomys russatus]|uniref:prostaglandin E2 receptor EP3 subtype n=1 Tax=Acomys russatus TaxID=60746 RepID=UPI0021E26935|nr:prostaglandin E2 receptor EP3 subtype [Acomys russatus]
MSDFNLTFLKCHTCNPKAVESTLQSWTGSSLELMSASPGDPSRHRPPPAHSRHRPSGSQAREEPRIAPGGACPGPAGGRGRWRAERPRSRAPARGPVTRAGMWALGGSDEAHNNQSRATVDSSSVSVAFPITMMVTGFVGNALAMLLVSRSYRRRESKRKKSFLLCIGWLALTDLVGQLLTSPVVILVYLSQRSWEQLDPSGSLCTFFGLAMTVFGLSSLLVASAMAVERALAIRAPHWYASHMKTRATRAVLLGVWLAVLAFALLPVLGVGRYSVQWPGTWCFISTGPAGNETDPALEPGSVAFASAFACLGLLALVVTFACNLATIKALVSRCRAKAASSQSSAQWGRITTETAIQLMGIMCVLSACWSPLLIMMLKMIFNQTSVEQCKTQTGKEKECNSFLIAVRLASLNQILDPWVYLLLRKILLQKFCQVANAVSSCSSNGQKGQPISLTNEVVQP